MQKKLLHNSMNKFFRLVIVSFFGLSAAFCSAQSVFEEGVTYYKNRAEKHQGLKVDSTNINLAIASFKKSLTTKNEQSLEFLLELFYYKGAFIESEKAKQKQTWLAGKLLGEKAIKKYPKNTKILLWFIANYSKYGEAQGVVASAKNGLADNIKTYAEQLLALDPKFADGAAYKLLGVINYKVPKIPLIISWPSKEKAEEYLIKALKENSKSVSNLYYYAEFLVEEKRETEAKVLLNKIVKTTPRTSYLIEDSYDINMAKKLLKKIK